ncbi:hypothetical protein ACET3Z_019438 [Daucus carota]
MPGLWKDFTSKIYKRTLGDWVSISLVAVPVIGTYFLVCLFDSVIELAVSSE